MLAPVTRSSAFTPIRSRRRQFDLYEPGHADVLDIEAEYRLVRVVRPTLMQRAMDVAAASAAAFLIIGSSLFMLEASNQRSGSLVASYVVSGPLQART